jgi:NADH-quinone oxidoreductase subunit F
VDLKFSDAEPSAEERDAIDRRLGGPGEGGWHGGARDEQDHRRAHTGRLGTRSRRHLVMVALHAVNDRVGWISPGALNHIGKRLSVSPADVYSVATFYALFSTNPRPKRIVHVCTDIACMARGSQAVCDSLEERLGPAGVASGWKHSPCLGLCERAPAALAVEAGDPPREHLIGAAGEDEIVMALNAGPAALAAEAPPVMAVPQAGQAGLMLLRRIGRVDPESIDDYLASEGYVGLRRAIEMGPAQVISEVKQSRLMGRGGAAFPAGI